jgi:nucleoside 2-deoxyribosyltransferase
MKTYLIGSLRNPNIPLLAQRLRKAGLVDVFDDWFSAGPEADDHWQAYEKARGRGLAGALNGHAAWHVFDYDKGHIDSSDAVVLVMPAGKSGHLEFGYAIGKGKRGYILLDGEPERFDVMYRFAEDVFTSEAKLTSELLDYQDYQDTVKWKQEQTDYAWTVKPGA